MTLRQLPWIAAAVLCGLGGVVLDSQRPERQASSWLQLLPADDAAAVTATVAIIDPGRYAKTDPDRSVDPEFYEGYGMVFEHDARDDGPICVERIDTTVLRTTFADLDVAPSRRCITLATLRQLIWEAP
jgi:hypothetical protein